MPLLPSGKARVCKTRNDGSIPSEGSNGLVAQSVERSVEARKVVGSIPTHSTKRTVGCGAKRIPTPKDRVRLFDGALRRIG